MNTAARSNRPEFTDADRKALVVKSLTAPNIGKLAHENGIPAGTLCYWRRQARSGSIELSAREHKALMKQMPEGRTRKVTKPSEFSKRLDAIAAKEIIVKSIYSKISLEIVAKRAGITMSYLRTLRAQARDGLIQIPEKHRKALQEQMPAQTRRKFAIAPATPVSTQPAKTTPAKAKSKAAAARKAEQTSGAAETAKTKTPTRGAHDVIVLRKGDLTLEIPSSLPAEHVKAAISAVTNT